MVEASCSLLLVSQPLVPFLVPFLSLGLIKFSKWRCLASPPFFFLPLSRPLLSTARSRGQISEKARFHATRSGAVTN